MALRDVKDAKRRLPVIQSASGAEDGDPPRQPWQWVGFGALAIVTAWLPASALAGAIATRIALRAGEGQETTRIVAAGLAIAATYAVALAAGAMAGGYMVGRWGASGAGVREAALAGLAAAAVAAVASWASLGLSPGVIAVALVAAPAAALGGRLGLRRRARAG